LSSKIIFLLFLIVKSENVGLKTQLGTIYGRQTQSSIEYLG